VPSKIELLLLRLKELKKWYNKLQGAKPDPQTAVWYADAALAEVLQSLSDPDVIAIIESNIPSARQQIQDAASTLHQDLITRQDELIELEIRLSRASGASRQDITLIYLKQIKTSPTLEGKATHVAELRESLKQLHEATKTAYAQSRDLPKTKKKQRKRNVGQGITSGVIGLILISSNGIYAPDFVVSYTLGGGAIHQAIRDLVGTKE
jgi:hypothetical protein